MRNELIERFTRYVKVNTQSNSESASCPSTPGQIDLAKMLVNELEEIGMSEITLDDNGYVMATLPSNTDKNIPTIGFLAHLDTATEFTGNKVKPRILDNYNGEDIVLNKEYNIVLSPKFSPELKNYIGHTLIVTDGTTLLGADDKAGIAEIMTAMSFLINNPDIMHGTIRVAFTPDEEIGRGPHKFDVDFFGAKYAYTVDGGPLGELQYESFNAAEAFVTIKGKNVHPGRAKNKMINSLKIAVEFNNQLPESESPENTEGYEGFYHLLSMNGDVEETKLHYIIRDHDKFKFEERKNTMNQIALELQEKYGIDRILLKINDQYYNMRDKIEPVKKVFNIAYDAMTNLGIEPKIDPIRGGTDGSQLSYMGLPTPNLFTGGENFHGRFEYISVENMVKSTEVILEIIRLYEERG